MKIWTIQNEEFCNKLTQSGKIESNWEAIDLDYAFAYEWICQQMSQRIGYKMRVPPIWVWYKYGGIHKKPDMRHSGYLPKGTKGVCIELEVEREDVLLSQFEMWNWILNQEYVPYDNREYCKIIQRKVQNALTHSEVMASWSRIFDLTFGAEEFWGGVTARWIQGCLPSIKLDWVKKVYPFHAK